jgi:hypothetical protein
MMLFVTFHGGSGGVNNLGAYSDDGKEKSLRVLHGADHLLSELRAVAFVAHDLLWVLSGAKKKSAILAFRGSAARYEYVATVAEYSQLDSLWHPFDFSLALPYVYVSNQDTNVVVRLKVASDLLSALPAPVAPALPSDGTFLAGTFVASANGDLPGVATVTTAVAPDAGGVAVELDSSSKKVSRSVRGVAWANGALYVADEAGSQIKVYDAAGTYLGGVGLKRPVHLMVTDVGGEATLYVSNGSQIFSGVLHPAMPAKFTLAAIGSVAVPKVAGLALSGDGTLFAASREHGSTNGAARTPKVHRYADFPASPEPAGEFTVADAPEFLLHHSQEARQ